MPGRAGAGALAIVAASLALAAAAFAEKPLTPDAAAACRGKLERIRQGALATSSESIGFTAHEANSYLHFDLAHSYPAGLSSVEVEFEAGRIAGTAKLDFDQLKRAARKPLPPMAEYLLFGVHDLRVEGRLEGSAGMGRFAIESVEMDGIPVPAMLLDLLISVFLKQRFPGLDLEAPFRLPHSIDRLTLSSGRLEVAGRVSANF